MAATVGSQGATIDAPPRAGQIVNHKDVRYTTIKEGLAHILVPYQTKLSLDPKHKDAGDENTQSVFYNPIQQFNRDLSVLAIKVFSEDFESRRRARASNRAGSGAKSARKRERQKQDRERQANEIAGPKPETSVGKDGHPDDSEEVATKADDGTAVSKAQAPKENSLKRKAETEAEDESVAKKSKMAGQDDQQILEPDRNGHPVLDPAEAAALPTGKRPDDKLRARMRILDALSATGLRALRYASELSTPTQVTANDLLPAATEAIKLNAAHNRLSHSINAVTSNAQAHMYSAAFSFGQHAYGKYDVIDLDPYGTAVPFLEAALLALNDGGMLCVTCTDAGVFNSMGYLEKTFTQYGGIPLKGEHAHEAGLRLILHAVATNAAKHGLHVEPLLSLSIDYYARVFVRVRHTPIDVKSLSSKTVMVHNCDIGCGSWSVQPLARASVQTGKKGGEFFKYHAALVKEEGKCEHCGCKTHLAGPMWGGPLHNPWFISRILDMVSDLDEDVYQTRNRIEGMLSSALDELEVIPSLDAQEKDGKAPVNGAGKEQTRDAKAADTGSPSPAVAAGPPTDARPSPSDHLHPKKIPAVPSHTADPHPFYFQPSAISGILKCRAPSDAVIKGALRHLGYVATRSHIKPGMIKTEAPWRVIWEVMREWVRREAPVRKENFRVGAPGWAILYGGDEEKSGAKGGGGEEDMEVQSVDGGGVKETGSSSGAGGAEGGGAERIPEKNGPHGGQEKEKDGVATGRDGSRLRIQFDAALGRDRVARKLVRYQQNPRANWGPMSKAKG